MCFTFVSPKDTRLAGVPWWREANVEGVLLHEYNCQKREHAEAPSQAASLNRRCHAHGNYGQIDEGEEVCRIKCSH